MDVCACHYLLLLRRLSDGERDIVLKQRVRDGSGEQPPQHGGGILRCGVGRVGVEGDTDEVATGSRCIEDGVECCEKEKNRKKL